MGGQINFVHLFPEGIEHLDVLAIGAGLSGDGNDASGGVGVDAETGQYFFRREDYAGEGTTIVVASIGCIPQAEGQLYVIQPGAVFPFRP